jgi:hypothetical protein
MIKMMIEKTISVEIIIITEQEHKVHKVHKVNQELMEPMELMVQMELMEQTLNHVLHVF